ncbi:hypothetical protein LTR16_004301, partial [Cryomyces antarcticus]
SVTLDAVTQILSHNTQLVHAEFRCIYSGGWVAQWLVELPNLQTLRLGGSDKQGLGSAALDIPALIKNTPNLRTLALCSWKLLNSFLNLDFSVLTKLEHLRLEKFPLNPYPRLPDSLRSLMMDVHRGTSHFVNLTHSYLPLLTELELSGCFALVVVQHLQEVIQQRRGSTVVTDAFPSLRKLSLDADTSCHQLQDLEWARNVEELRLQATVLTDAVVEQLPILFPRLTRLDLSRTRVTGVGVKAIVQQLGGQLAWLGVDFCPDLGPDAVEWARGRGIAVAHQMHVDLGGERKLSRCVRNQSNADAGNGGDEEDVGLVLAREAEVDAATHAGYADVFEGFEARVKVDCPGGVQEDVDILFELRILLLREAEAVLAELGLEELDIGEVDVSAAFFEAVFLPRLGICGSVEAVDGLDCVIGD